jgi:hypothetical protein
MWRVVFVVLPINAADHVLLYMPYLIGLLNDIAILLGKHPHIT